MAGKPPIGDRVIGWYGRVAADHLQDDPAFVRRWLMMGFKLMTFKSARLPDKKFHPSGRRGYATFMSSIVGALADPERSVITSVFCPTEPFRAMGLKPMTAEAVASFASGAQAEHAFVGEAQAQGLPETYCSYHKVLMGMALSDILEPSKLVASCSTACDANNLTFKALQDLWGCERAYIDVPYDLSRDACRYVAGQIRDMARVAEDAYHARLDEGRLRELVRAGAETDAALERTLEARGRSYLANTMTLDMMEMLILHLEAGSPEVARMVDEMAADYVRADGYRGLKIVWAHTSPYFLGALGSVLDCSQRAQIVASDMMFDHLTPPEGWMFSPDEPWERMAERLMRNCFNGPSERRADTLVELAKRTRADGVVIFCHWGCKQTAGASQLLRERLEEAGYPALVLDGDCVDRANCSEGQMATRFSAFLEMLDARKEASHAR